MQDGRARQAEDGTIQLVAPQEVAGGRPPVREPVLPAHLMRNRMPGSIRQSEENAEVQHPGQGQDDRDERRSQESLD